VPSPEIIDEAGTQLLTTDVADQLGRRFVERLRSAGLKPGTRVVFQAANSAEQLAGVYGALRAGFAPVVLSHSLTTREHTEMVADVSPCVSANDLPATGNPTTPTAHLNEPDLDDWFHCRPMHFTSGTSGRPKAVWSGWLTERQARALMAEETAAWGITAADRHLVCGPMSHSAPLRFPLLTLAAGGSVVIPRGFDPAVASGLIASGAATTTFMAPAHLQRILDAGAPTSHTLRLLAHAGSPCPLHARTAARACFGDEVIREFYGSTEGQFTICTPAEFDAHHGTVGRARPDRELRVDDEGRIWCRVPDHARFTYWNDADQTARAWDGDWFTVGDLGRLDSDGYLYLDGRRSDLVITGGVNVYPAEIERIVLELPGVRQAIAVGVADPKWGQRVCLAVVGDVTADEIRDHCVRQLAPAKRPKTIRLIDDLPLTHNGKVDRLRLPRLLGLGMEQSPETRMPN
jgi:acyl-CoA synthetase (AMP-forming)/AMP-acid ligase II